MISAKTPIHIQKKAVAKPEHSATALVFVCFFEIASFYKLKKIIWKVFRQVPEV